MCVTINVFPKFIVATIFEKVATISHADIILNANGVGAPAGLRTPDSIDRYYSKFDMGNKIHTIT